MAKLRIHFDSNYLFKFTEKNKPEKLNGKNGIAKFINKLFIDLSLCIYPYIYLFFTSISSPQIYTI